ncbi:conserved hypothetical protein [Treponema primitia ZAS-2]|uniref:Iron hydrogenase large subunit C-terminal domain-containing protein n=1 Tax=Treponema primitia (strain ATCC BAA-887 / DSM 12427 / ZAS-2) TaxID=545694 RepID=F5YIC6_TREPZ|nr:[Fe-Fe] hydrogenase large subunit C-terminal domain-containing protein [Treponema primitia]AEF84207.1 conserved hypothetical protein [Treponema primitia ZAS-2]
MTTDVQNSRNDLPDFFRDLKNGLPIRMLVAPAAFAVLEDLPRILGYLRSLGVMAFHPVLPYADITLWAYYRSLGECSGKPLITSACVGMNWFLKHTHPEYAEFITPVYSPLLCTARYLRSYRGITERIAFLSPCVLKRREFVLENREELVHYNVTINALSAWLKENPVDISQYEPCLPESDGYGPGLTLAAFGSIGKCLSALDTGVEYLIEQGLENAASRFSERGAFSETQMIPFVFETYACEGGCANGSGVRGMQYPASNGGAFLEKSTAPGKPEAVLELFSSYDQTLDRADFRHRPN